MVLGFLVTWTLANVNIGFAPEECALVNFLVSVNQNHFCICVWAIHMEWRFVVAMHEKMMPMLPLRSANIGTVTLQKGWPVRIECAKAGPTNTPTNWRCIHNNQLTSRA